MWLTAQVAQLVCEHRLQIAAIQLVARGLTCGCVLCTVLFVLVSGLGRGDQNIRLGLGRSSWSTIHWFDGVPWERDRVATRERVVCVFALGNSAVESPCRIDGSVIGRVSVADASLSLSLSLWDSCLLGHSCLRCGAVPRPAGFKARLDFSRPLGRSRAYRALYGLSCSPTRGTRGRLATSVSACSGALLGAFSLGAQEPTRPIVGVRS